MLGVILNPFLGPVFRHAIFFVIAFIVRVELHEIDFSIRIPTFNIGEIKKSFTVIFTKPPDLFIATMEIAAFTGAI